MESRGPKCKLNRFDLQFRMEISNVQRLVTYYLEIGCKNKKVEVARKILRYKRGSAGSPFHFLDFARGKGKAVVNEYPYRGNPQNSGGIMMFLVAGSGPHHRTAWRWPKLDKSEKLFLRYWVPLRLILRSPLRNCLTKAESTWWQ